MTVIINDISDALAGHRAEADSTATYCNATVNSVNSDGTVRITCDGASDTTLATTTATVSAGQRVTVKIDHHAAVITGNLTSISASSSDVDNLQRVIRETDEGIEVALVDTDDGTYEGTATLIDDDGMHIRAVDSSGNATSTIGEFTSESTSLNDGAYTIDAGSTATFSGAALSGAVVAADGGDGYLSNSAAYAKFVTSLDLSDNTYIYDGDDSTSASYIAGGMMHAGNSLFLRGARMPNIVFGTYDDLSVAAGDYAALSVTYCRDDDGNVRKFESPPVVIPTITKFSDNFYVRAGNRTTTGCEIRVYNNSSSAADVNVSWVIIGYVVGL